MNLSSDGAKPNPDRQAARSQPLRTRVKICGITNIADALEAVAAGADALGFVFFDKSSRAISAESAAAIIDQLPPFVNCVGLFVNPEAEEVFSTLRIAKLDVLQFHGDESAGFAEQFAKPYYTVVRVDESVATVARNKIKQHVNASGFLFDTYDATHRGGTGKTFDWSLFDATVPGAILAGGLHAENVSQAIMQTKPYAVDVSSGVESTPGNKSADLMREFVTACQTADRHNRSQSN